MIRAAKRLRGGVYVNDTASAILNLDSRRWTVMLDGPRDTLEIVRGLSAAEADALILAARDLVYAYRRARALDEHVAAFDASDRFADLLRSYRSRDTGTGPLLAAPPNFCARLDGQRTA